MSAEGEKIKSKEEKNVPQEELEHPQEENYELP